MANSLIQMCLKAQEARKERVNKAFSEKSGNLSALEAWYVDCMSNPTKAMENRDMPMYGYDPETKEPVLVGDMSLVDTALSVSMFAQKVGKRVSVKVTAREIANRADLMEDALFHTVVSNDYKSKASQRWLPGLYGKTPAQCLALGYTEKELITSAIKQNVILKDGVFTDAK